MHAALLQKGQFHFKSHTKTDLSRHLGVNLRKEVKMA